MQVAERLPVVGGSPAAASINERAPTAAVLRVAVVSGEATMYRCGLAAVLGSEPGLAYLGESPADQASSRLASQSPDLLLIDADLPQEQGFMLVQAFSVLLPQSRSALMTNRPDLKMQRRAANAGAYHLLDKGLTPSELITSLRAIAQASAPMAPPDESSRVALSANGAAPGVGLTRRQRQLLSLMAKGLSNQAIGDRIGVALPTVKFHVAAILNKLQVENRTSAVLFALRHQLVDLD
jgi:DNA-binding NarL/FixJ family response regulator